MTTVTSSRTIIETIDQMIKGIKEEIKHPAKKIDISEHYIIPLHIYNDLKDRGYIKDGKLTKKRNERFTLRG